MPMDPVTAMFVATAVGKVFGKLAGMFVDVDDPYEHYQNLIPWIRNYAVPGYLTSDEIREVIGKSPAAPVAEMNLAGKTSYEKARTIGAHRTNRAIKQNLSNTLHGINAELKLAQAKRDMRDRRLRLEMSGKQSIGAQQFKSSLMDAAGSKAIVLHEGQVARKQAVESLFGTGGTLAVAGGMNPDFRGWLGGVFSGGKLQV